MTKKINDSFQTSLAQGGDNLTTPFKPIIPGIFTSTTYQRDEDNQYRSGRVYSRADNPTYDAPEKLIAQLEHAADAKLFASGMAAATAVFQALKPGHTVLAPNIMYWALRNWLKGLATDAGLHIHFIDMTQLDEVKAYAQQHQPQLIWLETPGNPLWTISDIRAIAEIAKQHGAKVAVDSTVATPILTRPLELGADIVMHSATKYLNGHSDVISGALATAVKDDFWQRILAVRAQGGAVPSPMDAAQLLRGMRTLFLRVRESCESAQFLAEQLEQHPMVSEVLYPGLPSFAGHAIACQQMEGGFGGMLSIRLAGGAKQAIGTAAKTKLWHRATSLGGVESLIEHRASIEGAGTPVPDDLLRLSVGIERKEDLLADLVHAIEASA
tara:strand:- start:1023 stop:2174 length:1152 start_codon:yes stop_codon:yes gene_type:complete